MNLLRRIVSRCMTLAYFAMHKVVPQAILLWVAGVLPYKADAYAPGAFFVKPPVIPREGGGYFTTPPLSLLVLTKSALVTGTVVAVEMYIPNPPWGHQTFYIRPDNKGLLNAYFNQDYRSWPGTNGTIKCRAPVTMKDLPKIGSRIIVHGAFGIDLAWGFTTIRTSLWVEVVQAAA